MRARPQDDAGSTHVLEAVIMASIMVSAVVYVVTFETPPSASSPTRDALKQMAQDALSGLYDTPVADSSFGENALSVLLAECMGGNCTGLEDKLDHVLPEGTSYAVYISNGYSTFPVHVPSEPRGEAITATHLLEPKWSHSFVTTGTTNVNPASDSLVTFSLPVFNSNTLSQGGSPLRVIVHGTRTSDGANYTVTGSFSTQAVGTEDEDLYPAVSMYFLGADGKAAASRDVSAQALDLAGLPSGASIPFTVRINETAGVALPKGTELTLSLPRGWTANANQTVNQGNWTVLSNATSANSSYAASDVAARLTRDVTSGTVDFVFNATYKGDVLDWYPFQARLSKGALSEANVLVRAKTGASASVFAVPQMGMSVPRPMGATATTTWTLVVDVPVKVDETVAVPKSNVRTGKNLGAQYTSPDVTLTSTQDFETEKPDILLQRIEIIEQDGAPIFGSLTPVTTGGKWTVEPDRLVWEGNHSNSRGPLDLVFNVAASGHAGAAGSKNPFVPPVEFDTYKSRLLSQVAPGFYRGVFLPESLDQTYPGYENAEELDVGIRQNFTSDSIYKTTLLPGTSNYTLNPLPSFQDSIHGSYVNVERRNVSVGGTAVISADVQSLLFALSQAGISAGVNLHVYPPWSGDLRDPIYSKPNLDSGLLGSDVTKMTLMDLNADAFPDVVIGTSNGRVLALDGPTGKRLQGNVFTAPLYTAGAVNGTVTSITHLAPYHTPYGDFIVVGTDREGAGVYVLNKDLSVRWSYAKQGGQWDVVSMDTSADVNGGGADVVLGASNGGVYVLRPPTPAEEAADGAVLKPLKSQYPAEQNDALGALYTTTGEPTAVVGLDGMGPNTTRGGIAATFQSNPDVIYSIDWDDPVEGDTTVGVSSLPRAGFQAVDNTGKETWTFFGSPVTVARSYDYDGDAARDVVGGSPAGYVYMMNGLTATQPLYSQLYYPTSSIKDGDAHDAFNAVFLTSDGQARVTTTGWNDNTCAYCSATVPLPATLYPRARAIALNASHSFWVVGEENTMLRTTPGRAAVTGEPAPHYPELAVVPPNGTKGGLPYLPEHTYNFNDVTFGWGGDRDKGWVVAGKCLNPDCDESLVMRTTDGGVNWVVYGHDQEVVRDGQTHSRLAALDGTNVRVELTRLNFTTPLVGWIVGHQGTLLRTTDGGETWKGVATPTPDPILDVSCDPVAPGFCMIITETGAWRSKNALAAAHADVAWEKMELDLVSSTPPANVDPEGDALPAIEGQEHALQTRALRSVGVVDGNVSYIGAENAVFKTLDGGRNWTGLPMNYVEADANRVVSFQDGRGFIFGGNATHARVFYLHDYAIESAAQTERVYDIPAGERAVRVDLTADYSFFERKAYVDFLASANGGENWLSLGPIEENVGEVREQDGLSTYVRVSSYRTWLDDDNEGTDVRLRFEFHNTGDYTLLTAQVRNPVVSLLLANQQNQTREVTFELDLTDPAMRDVENTTADWDLDHGVLHQPLVKEYWTRNVSGEVRALEAGFNVSGDSRNDVWVATGGVLAANSPEHLIYAGSDADKYLKNDNRVYLLDGSNGSVIARTSSFLGNVTHLSLSDANGDGKPELLFATTWDASRNNGTLVALDPLNLTLHWTTWLDLYQPSDLEAGIVQGPLPTAVVGTRPSETGSNAIPGKVYAFEADDGDVHWGTIPDQQGRYSISVDVPDEWFFGPYVVEVEVRWTNEIHEDVEGVAQTREVLQTARFYDYFLVTPPNALSPPSPVYQVHLVTWFDEWE